MDLSLPEFISNFANADQVKVAEVLSILGRNYLMKEGAYDKFYQIIPHAFSVWTIGGNPSEFWNLYKAMNGDDDDIKDILTKWFPQT